MRTWLSGAIAASFAVAPATGAADYYAGADLAYLRIPIASADFDGFGLKLRAGASLPSGWGAEVQTVVGLSDDSVGGLTLQADNISAAFLRYETSPGNDYRFFIVAGYATTSFSYEGDDTNTLDDRFSGFAWGVGAQERLSWLPNAMAILEINQYLGDSNVDIWSMSFGVRYDF